MHVMQLACTTATDVRCCLAAAPPPPSTHCCRHPGCTPADTAQQISLASLLQPGQEEIQKVGQGGTEGGQGAGQGGRERREGGARLPASNGLLGSPPPPAAATCTQS